MGLHDPSPLPEVLALLPLLSPRELDEVRERVEQLERSNRTRMVAAAGAPAS